MRNDVDTHANILLEYVLDENPRGDAGRHIRGMLVDAVPCMNQKNVERAINHITEARKERELCEQLKVSKLGLDVAGQMLQTDDTAEQKAALERFCGLICTLRAPVLKHIFEEKIDLDIDSLDLDQRDLLGFNLSQARRRRDPVQREMISEIFDRYSGYLSPSVEAATINPIEGHQFHIQLDHDQTTQVEFDRFSLGSFQQFPERISVHLSETEAEEQMPFYRFSQTLMRVSPNVARVIFDQYIHPVQKQLTADQNNLLGESFAEMIRLRNESVEEREVAAGLFGRIYRGMSGDGIYQVRERMSGIFTMPEQMDLLQAEASALRAELAARLQS